MQDVVHLLLKGSHVRICVAILGDQLLRDHPALLQAQQLTAMHNISVLMVESDMRLRSRPYHRHKLVLIRSALRHYAAELREAGWQVTQVCAPSWRAALTQHCRETNPHRILTMAASEYAPRQAQAQWQHWLGVPVTVLENTQFLSATYNPIAHVPTHKVTVMEPFYRAMRRHFGLLMHADGRPYGDRWNYDSENRKALPARQPLPAPLTTSPDTLTQAVMADVATMPQAIGDAQSFAWGVTHADAAAVLARFIAERLPWFGDYEDAMAADHDTLFHSTLSPYLNIGLLTPRQVLDAAVAAYDAGMAPLAAVEGFVRQILGWREYMYVQYWRHMPALQQANGWHATRPLPEWFWHGQSGMRCLDTVIARVWRHGYTHHIERLMLLCNYALLAGIDPVAVNHWFLAVYIDAYDWVMWPNVSGMGLHADGGKIATKPYIASATYINKMGNFCAGCRYNPRQRVGADACPFNLLYWNFLLTHESVLRANPRMGPAVLGLRHLADAERTTIRQQATMWLDQ